MLTYRDKPKDYKIFGIPGVDFEYEALEQMNKVMSIPVSLEGAVMPDAHVGYGMPIGGVAALKDAVSPNFVGYDIACRMTLTILDIDIPELLKNRELIAGHMLASSSFGVGSISNRRTDHPVMYSPLWKELSHLKELQSLAEEQLGTSGSGNHFFNAMIGQVVNEADWLPLNVGDKFVAIMTHSGSRGVGHKLATHYIKLAKQETKAIAKGIPRDYEWLDIRKDSGREYLKVMSLMGEYAEANHQIIHDSFLKKSGLKQIVRYQNHHNFAWEGPNGIVIHRKGATPAQLGQIGIIPGSSGTASYLVEGRGEVTGLCSSSHGAGRKFSRNEAKAKYKKHIVDAHMKDYDILGIGINKDETLMAYKDIEHVMDLQKDLVSPVARMLPKVVIMAGKRN